MVREVSSSKAGVRTSGKAGCHCRVAERMVRICVRSQRCAERAAGEERRAYVLPSRLTHVANKQGRRPT